MIVVDNNEMNGYGGRHIIRQDLSYLVHELSSSLLMELHSDIIKELKRRDEKPEVDNAKNNPSD